MLLADRRRSCSVSRINSSLLNECDGSSRRLTPLMRACVKGHSAVVEELTLDPDCDVNIEDARGNTALVLAAAGALEGQGLSCVRALLRGAKAAHHHINVLGESVLEAVVRASRDDQRPSDPVSGTLLNTSNADRCVSGSLPIAAIAEIVAAGGTVTERFVRRLGRLHTSSLFTRLGFKIVSPGTNDRSACSRRGDLRRSAQRPRTSVTLQIPCASVDTADTGGENASTSSHMWSTVPWLLPTESPDHNHCDVEFLLDSTTLQAHAFVVSKESPLLGSLIAQLRAQQYDRHRVMVDRVSVDCTQHSTSAFTRMMKWMYTREVFGQDPHPHPRLYLISSPTHPL